MNGQDQAPTSVGFGRPLEVLREASAAGRTAKIVFHTPAGGGVVWLRNGHPVDAGFRRLNGERALVHILSYAGCRWLEEPNAIAPRQELYATTLEEVARKSEIRQQQWRELLTTLPPLCEVLEVVRKDVSLEGARREVLARIDEQRPLHALLDDLDLDPVAVLSSVGQLLNAGIVRTRGTQPQAEARGTGIDLAAEGALLEVLHEVDLQRVSSTGEAAGRVPSEGPQRSQHDADALRRSVHDAETTGTTDDEASQSTSAVLAGRPQQHHPVVGRYEILGRLGRGGMATVYLCRVHAEGGFSRHFAMKVLRRHLCESPDAVQMLLREARLTGRLHHPNVVSVVDVGSDRGQPYLVMEYVPGCSVADLLEAEARGELLVTAGVAAAVVVEALAGLHAAHTLGDEQGRLLGLVHQDVSPENLLVGFDGVARVTDFGVAHVSDSLDAGRQDRGKPQYLAPERITTDEVDRRSDIFAVGVVLYRLLTGLHLFEGDSSDDVMQQVLYKPIAPPSTVGRCPHPAFDPVCLRALERQPGRRYQSAEHFRADLLKTAVLIDQLALGSHVAELARRAARPLSAGPSLEKGSLPDALPVRGPEPRTPDHRAIVLAPGPRQPVARSSAQAETQVLATRRESRPVPAWVVALFLALSLGLALALDALSDSGPEPPPLPAEVRKSPDLLDTLDIRVDLEGENDFAPEPDLDLDVAEDGRSGD